MYRPKYHALTDIAEMQAHIDQHPLGAWVCTGAGELIANHIPFVLEREGGHLQQFSIWVQGGAGGGCGPSVRPRIMNSIMADQLGKWQ